MNVVFADYLVKLKLPAFGLIKTHLLYLPVLIANLICRQHNMIDCGVRILYGTELFYNYLTRFACR